MYENRGNFWQVLFFTLYLAFCISLVFAFRAFTSFSIALLAFLALIFNKIEQKRFFNSALGNPVMLACSFFFLVECSTLLHTGNQDETRRNLFGMSLVIAIPFFIFNCDFINRQTRKKILQWYCIFLFVACVFALFNAWMNFLVTGDESVFIYHSLVLIYSGHAIQFSILVFVAIIHLAGLLQKKEIFITRIFHWLLLAVFIFFLFLLSSKLVISFFVLYFVFFVLRLSKLNMHGKKPLWLLVAGFAVAVSLFFMVPNPINNRFKEIVQTDFHFLRQKTYDPGLYFNGLQFRMLQWRFVPEILDEKNAWWKGVSPGDAQSLLNEKYISSRMYIGDPARGDKGFLGYNAHDEYLQALLEAGIPGLLAFVLIILCLLQLVIKRKNAALSFVSFLLIAYSFNESVFETQYSMIIFLFFPLFLYVDKQHNQ